MTKAVPPKTKAPAAKPKAAKSVTSKRTYDTRLVSKSKGQPVKPKYVRPPTNPVAQGLRPHASMKKTSTGALAAGPDDPKYTAITPLVVEAFLAALAISGMPTLVARELRVHYLSLRVLYREDPTFKNSWDAAMVSAFEHHEDEVRRRAFTGYKREVYQQGMYVGSTTEYSDRLAEMMIKAGKPELYNPKTTTLVEHAGSVAVAYAHMSDDDLNAAINKKLSFLGVLPPNTGAELAPDDLVDTAELNKQAGKISG